MPSAAEHSRIAYEPAGIDSPSLDPAPREPHRRVLIVGGGVHACKLAEIQSRAGFELVAAAGLDEAVRELRSGPCALVLIGIDSEDARSGIDLLNGLRALPECKELPVIACSRRPMRDVNERLAAAGFDGYIEEASGGEQQFHALNSDAGSEGASPDHTGRFELQLPPMPSTLPEILSLLSRKEKVPDTDRLVEILGKDAVASARVIRHANSTYFSLVQKVSNIERAVLILGFDPVCNLVLTEVMMHLFSSVDTPAASRIYLHIMRLNVGTAAFARLLGQHLGLRKPDTAFTAGLLHQLGRLVFLSSDSRRYCGLWEMDTEHPDRAALAQLSHREFEAYGTDYAQLGAEISSDWQLPDDLQIAIRYHNDPKSLPYKKHRALMLIVAVAHDASLELFDGPGHQKPAGRKSTQKQEALAELASMFRVKEDKLAALLRDKKKDVRAFVKGILSR